MGFVALAITGMVIAFAGISIGYYTAARHTKEMWVAALTLAYDHSTQELDFDEMMKRVSTTLTTPEGARAVRALLAVVRKMDSK